ncbi:MAG: hypothetical protein ACREP7_00540 [Lysobacter sp.]
MALTLLGAGLDALLTRSPAVSTADERLDRYRRALAAHPLKSRTAPLRYSIGEQFQRAWRRGIYPNLRAIRALMPRGAATHGDSGAR